MMKVLNRLFWTLGLVVLFTLLILGVRMLTAALFSPLERVLPPRIVAPLFWAIQGAIIAVPGTRFFLMRRWIMFGAVIIAFVISLGMGPA